MAQTLFNSKPYFDDFDPEKNFYKVLFKPGYAVQARELNQLQSILQHQITGISNHLFKKNTVIIPGGVAINNSADILSIVGVGDPSALVGSTITNAENFDIEDDSSLDGYITAIVLGSKAPTETAPAAIYIKYIKGQPDGRGTFNLSEQLKTVGRSITTFSVDSSIGSTIGRTATISKGVFYTRELFVDCPSQSTIIEINKETVSNCTIGLTVQETVVTSDQDESLLDNATGSPNQYAPGADRYKVDLVLTVRDGTTEIVDDKFITMIVLENNVITYINNKTEYAELMKTLARRTYDANGNFIVNGLNIAVNESSDTNYVWAHVGKGKCYLGGYEYEQIVSRSLAIDKPRDAGHRQAVEGTRRFADELPHLTVAGGPWMTEIPERFSLVTLLDAEPGAVGVSVIGYAIFRDIQYLFGGINSQDVYRMFFDSITLNSGYTFNDVGGVKAITAGAGQGAAVLHELRLTNVNGSFNAGNIIQAATTTAQEGRLYTFLNNAAFLIKNDPAKEIPAVDLIKDVTTLATAQRAITYITNYTPDLKPLISIDSSPIYTLKNGPVNYYTVRKKSFTALAEGANDSDPLTSGTYESYSYTNYIAYNVTDEEFVDLTGLITINEDADEYTITIPSASGGTPHPLFNKQVDVYATVRNTEVSNASASSASHTIDIRTPSRSWMALGHGEVTKVDRIVEGAVVDIEDIVLDDVGTPTLATITTSENHNLLTGNIIVITGVASTANPSATYDQGFNDIFQVTGITSPTEFTISWSTVDEYVSGGQVKLPANINSAERDITNRYIIDRNQSTTLVQTSLIKLRKGVTPPSGQIAVKYSCRTFGSNVNDTNYVSVDSYGTYTSGDLSYIGQINDIIDNNNQRVTPLRNYLDFRTRTSTFFFRNVGLVPANDLDVLILRDLNISYFRDTLTGKYVVGPGFENGAVIINVRFDPITGNSIITLSTSSTGEQFGSYYIGLSGAGLSVADKVTGSAKTFLYPKFGTRIEYDYIKFLPKRVMVFINRQNDRLTLEYREVSSLEDVLKVRRSMYKLPLMYLHMKPYTVSMQDVSVVRFENPVYQMLDIHALREKIDRNEYYASLALNRDISKDIIDTQLEFSTATVKRGFWNENLVNLSNQSYSSDDFSCTIYDRTYVAPGTVFRTVPLQLDSTINSTTWSQKGLSVMLPYTEQVAYSNTQASKFNNLNPFNMINWSEGKLTLTPHVDNWIDMTVEPAAPVVNNITNVTNTTNVTNITNTTTNVNVNNNITNNITASGTIQSINVNSINETNIASLGDVVTMPIIQTDATVIAPAPPVDEIVVSIDNLRTSWGPDSAGGSHAITFDWTTNLGRTGRVNTDTHLSTVIGTLGRNGYNGTTANALINRLYNDPDVRDYLFAGTHFDQRPPSQW